MANLIQSSPNQPSPTQPTFKNLQVHSGKACRGRWNAITLPWKQSAGGSSSKSSSITAPGFGVVIESIRATPPGVHKFSQTLVEGEFTENEDAVIENVIEINQKRIASPC